MPSSESSDSTRTMGKFPTFPMAVRDTTCLTIDLSSESAGEALTRHIPNTAPIICVASIIICVGIESQIWLMLNELNFSRKRAGVKSEKFNRLTTSRPDSLRMPLRAINVPIKLISPIFATGLIVAVIESRMTDS